MHAKFTKVLEIVFGVLTLKLNLGLVNLIWRHQCLVAHSLLIYCRLGVNDESVGVNTAVCKCCPSFILIGFSSL